MERYPFSYKITIPAYDCDVNNRLSASSALRYALQVSGRHLDSLGFHAKGLIDDGMVFVLAAIAVRFGKHPVGGQEIVISTALHRVFRRAASAESAIFDKNGGCLIEFQTSWA